MSKRNILLIAAVAAIAIPLAYAANVHFKGPNPTFVDQGTTLSSCFSLTGLGNQDVIITIKATGFATTTCTNQGGNAAPGQNKTPVSPTGQISVPSTQIKNGNLRVCLTTQPPPAPTAKEAGCPNNNWATSLQDVEFTTAEIIVMQGGQVVLDTKFPL